MEQMQMNMPDIYDAALYLRLSKDDVEEGDAKSESNSIANQRELLRSIGFPPKVTLSRYSV